MVGIRELVSPHIVAMGVDVVQSKADGMTESVDVCCLF